MLLTATGLGLAGAGIGAAIAVAAPDYYRFVFRLPPERGIDASFGAVLGGMQGVVAGLAVGVAICFAAAWRDVRVAEAAARKTEVN